MEAAVKMKERLPFSLVVATFLLACLLSFYVGQ
jgi:hypothetical protein